ncbi:MAG: hypothetical protein D6B27_01200 [Gammaproteobacteria bacterium]|nr:MAG: hypothetical protein D6B27_01200 [Gammaproteobacteria bacterium]
METVNEITDEKLYLISESIRQVVIETLSGCDSGRLSIHKGDMKGHHLADQKVYESIKRFAMDKKVASVIFIEGEETIYTGADSNLVLLIDPVDGSVNRDLKVGDPALSIAFSEKRSPKFEDIIGGYVYCLHSGNEYFSIKGKSYFRESKDAEFVQIFCDSKVDKLEDAILYFNDGYGKEMSKSAFLKAGALPYFVKHRNAFDNSAAEICQMARGAAHIRVEARSYENHNGSGGSDHANILSAFAIAKPAGIKITDLSGENISGLKIEMDKPQDFICATSREILQQVVAIISENRSLLNSIISVTTLQKNNKKA